MQIVYSLIVLIFTSCATNNRVGSTDQLDDIPADAVLGTVTTQYADKGCNLLIQLKEDSSFLRPIELDQNYQVDGMEIWIKYHVSRASNAGCDIAIPIVIDTIGQKK